MEQEELQKERRLKRKLSELKRTIRVLICIVLVLILATSAMAFLLIYPFFNKTDSFVTEDAGRFEGDHRVEQFKISCSYENKTDEDAGSYTYITDVLKFGGEGYEKVAAAVEEYFSENDLHEYITWNYEMRVGLFSQATTQLECTRMDDTVVSVKRLFRYAEGSGFFSQDGVTFLVKTGKLLELDDLLKDKKGFYSVIHELILAQLPATYPVITELCPDYEEIYRKDYSDAGRTPSWHLVEDGIAFSFEDLQFLSRSDAMPCMMVVIPYEMVSAYVKPEYIVQGK